jgi:hypothetical protein
MLWEAEGKHRDAANNGAEHKENESSSPGTLELNAKPGIPRGHDGNGDARGEHEKRKKKIAGKCRHRVNLRPSTFLAWTTRPAIAAFHANEMRQPTDRHNRNQFGQDRIVVTGLILTGSLSISPARSVRRAYGRNYDRHFHSPAACRSPSSPRWGGGYDDAANA